MTVRYQPLCGRSQSPITPVPPLLAPLATEESDASAAKLNWVLYISSLACCFCCFPISLIISPITWMVSAAMYFRKPQQLRERFPRQRTPAVAALVTCFVAVFLAALAIALGIGFWIGLDFSRLGPPFNPGGHDSHDHGHHHGHGHHDHGHHHQGHEDVDWPWTFDACPTWGSFALSECAHGPESCTRVPNTIEMKAICSEVSSDYCRMRAEETGAIRWIEEPCEELENIQNMKKQVDWSSSMAACPALGKYASLACNSGDCTRDPTTKETAAICREVAAGTNCHAVAENTGAIKLADLLCEHRPMKLAPQHPVRIAPINV